MQRPAKVHGQVWEERLSEFCIDNPQREQATSVLVCCHRVVYHVTDRIGYIPSTQTSRNKYDFIFWHIVDPRVTNRRNPAIHVIPTAFLSRTAPFADDTCKSRLEASEVTHLVLRKAAARTADMMRHFATKKLNKYLQYLL